MAMRIDVTQSERSECEWTPHSERQTGLKNRQKVVGQSQSILAPLPGRDQSLAPISNTRLKPSKACRIVSIDDTHQYKLHCASQPHKYKSKVMLNTSKCQPTQRSSPSAKKPSDNGVSTNSTSTAHPSSHPEPSIKSTVQNSGSNSITVSSRALTTSAVQ